MGNANVEVEQDGAEARGALQNNSVSGVPRTAARNNHGREGAAAFTAHPTRCLHPGVLQDGGAGETEVGIPPNRALLH